MERTRVSGSPLPLGGFQRLEPEPLQRAIPLTLTHEREHVRQLQPIAYESTRNAVRLALRVLTGRSERLPSRQPLSLPITVNSIAGPAGTVVSLMPADSYLPLFAICKNFSHRVANLLRLMHSY